MDCFLQPFQPRAAVADDVPAFGKICFIRAVEKVLKVSSQKDLLDFNKVLKESIRLRNPYVDPLNYIQIRFLEEIRRTGENTRKGRKIDEILLLTVNGIAFGMKSTG